MNEDDFKRLLQEALEPIKGQLGLLNELPGQVGRLTGQVGNLSASVQGILSRLDDPETWLVRINERLDSHTVSLLTIETELKTYGDMYKINMHNIERLDTRLTTVEDGLDITPAEDLKVPHFSN